MHSTPYRSTILEGYRASFIYRSVHCTGVHSLNDTGYNLYTRVYCTPYRSTFFKEIQGLIYILKCTVHCTVYTVQEYILKKIPGLIYIQKGTLYTVQEYTLRRILGRYLYTRV